MARASTPTLLSIDRFSTIIGLNPAHFNQSANSNAMPYTDCCTDIWFQHDYQFNGRVSREALAYAISDAERDIAEVAGYWPAPQFIDKEMHTYTHPHRNDMRGDGMTPYGLKKPIIAKWGKFIQAGQRGTTLIATPTVAGATLVYSDADGDGVVDTATVTATTTLTDACEVKVYFAGHSGLPEWEIRPPRTRAIAGGTYTATFWAWQFIDPDLWEVLPDGTDPVPIDFDEETVPGTYDNLVTSVEVYREFADFTEESCQYFWEMGGIDSLTCDICGGSGCVACSLTVQDGCIHVRDVDNGIVVPALGSYDSDTSQWLEQAPSVCREPDQVKIWYQAGDIDDLYLAGRSCDPLSHWWAQTITWLATSKLERPFCSCDNVVDLVKDLRTDLAAVGGPLGYNISLEDLSNPFGTRKGAVLAWRRVSKLARRRARVAVI